MTADPIVIESALPEPVGSYGWAPTYRYEDQVMAVAAIWYDVAANSVSMTVLGDMRAETSNPFVPEFRWEAQLGDRQFVTYLDPQAAEVTVGNLTDAQKAHFAADSSGSPFPIFQQATTFTWLNVPGGTSAAGVQLDALTAFETDTFRVSRTDIEVVQPFGTTWRYKVRARYFDDEVSLYSVPRTYDVRPGAPAAVERPEAVLPTAESDILGLGEILTASGVAEDGGAVNVGSLTLLVAFGLTAASGIGMFVSCPDSDRASRLGVSTTTMVKVWLVLGTQLADVPIGWVVMPGGFVMLLGGYSLLRRAK